MSGVDPGELQGFIASRSDRMRALEEVFAVDIEGDKMR